MSNIQQDIQKMLQKAAIDGTLTHEAVKFVDETISASKGFEKALDKARSDLADKNKECDRINNSLVKSLAENKAWQDREILLLERETHMTTLELNAKHEATRVTDHKEMFGQVFRNIETRRNVFTPVPGQQKDNGCAVYGTEGTVERDEEKTSHE